MSTFDFKHSQLLFLFNMRYIPIQGITWFSLISNYFTISVGYNICWTIMCWIRTSIMFLLTPLSFQPLTRTCVINVKVVHVWLPRALAMCSICFCNIMCWWKYTFLAVYMLTICWTYIHTCVLISTTDSVTRNTTNTK